MSKEKKFIVYSWNPRDDIPEKIQDDPGALSIYLSVLDGYEKDHILDTVRPSDITVLSDYAKLCTECAELISKQNPYPEQRYEEIAGSRGNIVCHKTQALLEWEALNEVLDKKRKLILSMEDRLLLNPLSKAKRAKLLQEKENKKDLRTVGFAGI